MKKTISLLAASLLAFTVVAQEISTKLDYLDVFNIEYVSDPRISPDGSKIIYVRNFKDVMTDRNLSNLWIINFDGTNNRPLTTGNQNDFSPRWTPDGNRVVYKSSRDGKTQLYMRWLDTGSEAKLSNLTESSGSLSISPDGKWVAFPMFVPYKPSSLVSLPQKPAGAKWNDPPSYIDKMKYRSDGAGYLKSGYRQLFILSLDGGTPRQITTGEFDHGATASWTPDSRNLVFSANRHPEGEYDTRNTEVFIVSLDNGNLTQLTDRQGPDSSPKVSPDGKLIAYTGYDDRYEGYQISELYVMNIDGSGSKMISDKLDRSIGNIQWAGDSKGIFFQHGDKGDGVIAHAALNGKVGEKARNMGGLSLGRPYSGGTYSVASNGNIAFTIGSADHPADLAAGRDQSSVKRLTRLNDDLFAFKKPAEVEEIWYKSSHDGRDIQGWICKPPGFDPSKKYPLILEIHGGPFAAYGPWYSLEVQLYASAGYVVLYTNPRGSSSYGKEFGNLIHHAYPSNDYDDLMSGVDAVIEKGYVDRDNLFVTGGSGGGVLTAWIVGHTDRFRAAVVAKPVINWYSFVLYADNPATYYKYWFPGYPWDHLEHYMKRSPLSYAKNVKTPTMLLTGEEDHRTPIPESEQYYTALKLNKVESALVRIPGASHGIAARPSNLIAKVAYIVGWFEKYRSDE